MECAVFATEIGWMAAAASAGRLKRLTIGDPSRAAAVRSLWAAAPRTSRDSAGSLRWLEDPKAESNWWSELMERLQAYAAGEVVCFDSIDLDLDHATRFQRRVLDACRRIPLGSTSTYGELALAAGAPGSARAVGNVMARNTCPIVIPCHRVVQSGGRLGGFSAPRGVHLKRELLAMEARAVGALPLLSGC